MIAHEEHVDNVREALRASGLNAIVVVSRAGRLIVEDGRRRGKRRKRAAAALETDVAFHAYSSSGALRAAVLTHANVVASAVRAGSARGDRIDDVTLATHRQCDVGALIGETLSRLISGGTVAILGKADAQKALAMIEEHRVTDLSLSADLLGSLLDEERLPRRAIRSVRRILLRGTGTSLTAKRRLADSLPDAELVQSYGKVETSDAICLAHHTQIFSKPDVLGTPHPGLMVEVVNAEGRPVRNGTTGEIVCRGSVVMRAYHRDPRATRASLRDGWFRTGDLGYIDGDGDLQWAGGDTRDTQRIRRDQHPARGRAAPAHLRRHPRDRLQPPGRRTLGDDAARRPRRRRDQGREARARRRDPLRAGARTPSEIGSLNFWGLNRSKRGITIDIATDEGVRARAAAGRQADVLLENFRPGVMDRHGLGYETLPSSIRASSTAGITAFGPTGPMAQKPGMDLILQATGGVMGHHRRGRAGRPSSRRRRSRTSPPASTRPTRSRRRCSSASAPGDGQKVEVAMLDAVVSLLADIASQESRRRPHFAPFGSGHPDIVPYQAFRARDGYFIVACLTNAFWKRLPAAIGRPELLEDPRFPTMRDRVKNRAELVEVAGADLRRADVAHWIERIEAADIPTCRVNTLREVFALPQIAENETLVRVPHPTRGEIAILNSPVKMQRQPEPTSRAARRRSASTPTRCSRASASSAAELAELRARGVI